MVPAPIASQSQKVAAPPPAKVAMKASSSTSFDSDGLGHVNAAVLARVKDTHLAMTENVAICACAILR